MQVLSPRERVLFQARLISFFEKKIIVGVEMQLGKHAFSNKLVRHFALDLQLAMQE